MLATFQAYDSKGYNQKNFQAIFQLLESNIEPLTKIGNDDPPQWEYKNSYHASQIADNIFSKRIEPDSILGIEIYARCKRSYQISIDQTPNNPHLAKATRCNFRIYKPSAFTGGYISTDMYRDLLNQLFFLTESIVAFSGVGWFHEGGFAINWYTIFGEPYFDLLGGKTAILKAPAFQTYDLGNAVAIRATEHPWPNGGDWHDDNAAIRLAIAEYLDPEGVSIIRPGCSSLKHPRVPLP